VGEFRWRARCRRTRDARCGASWYFAKNAPKCNLAGGKCSQNATLSQGIKARFYLQLTSKLHDDKAEPLFATSKKSAQTHWHVFTLEKRCHRVYETFQNDKDKD
jgi:hypothetical protein